MVSRIKKFFLDKFTRTSTNAEQAAPSTPHPAAEVPITARQSSGTTLETIHSSKVFTQQSIDNLVSPNQSESMFIRNSSYTLCSAESEEYSEAEFLNQQTSSTSLQQVSTPEVRNSNMSTVKSRRSTETLKSEESTSRARQISSCPNSGTPMPPPRVHRRRLPSEYPNELNPFEEETVVSVVNLVPTSNDFVNKLYTETRSSEVIAVDENTLSERSIMNLEPRINSSDVNIPCVAEHVTRGHPQLNSTLMLKNTEECADINAEGEREICEVVLKNKDELIRKSDDEVVRATSVKEDNSNVTEHKRSIKKKKAPMPPNTNSVV